MPFAGQFPARLAGLYAPNAALFRSHPNRLNQLLVKFVNDPLFWGTLGVVLGTYAFIRGFRLLQRKRFILNTPQSTVRAAALGPVEISGKAAGPYTLVSPLSKADCFYYRLVAWHIQGNRKRASSIEECAPIFLNDGTGNLMIDPHGAEIQFPPLATQESGFIPNYLRHFLVQHGERIDNLIKVEEFCIRPDDTLFVFGTLQEIPWKKSPAHETPFARIGPGFLTEAEAEVQRRGAVESLDRMAATQGEGGRPATAATVQVGEFDLAPETILGKGPGLFLISNCSQRELVESLDLKSILYIWGGPALAVFCLYALLQRLTGL